MSYSGDRLEGIEVWSELESIIRDIILHLAKVEKEREEKEGKRLITEEDFKRALEGVPKEERKMIEEKLRRVYLKSSRDGTYSLNGRSEVVRIARRYVEFERNRLEGEREGDRRLREFLSRLKEIGQRSLSWRQDARRLLAIALVYFETLPIHEEAVSACIVELLEPHALSKARPLVEEAEKLRRWMDDSQRLYALYLYYLMRRYGIERAIGEIAKDDVLLEVCEALDSLYGERGWGDLLREELQLVAVIRNTRLAKKLTYCLERIIGSELRELEDEVLAALHNLALSFVEEYIFFLDPNKLKDFSKRLSTTASFLWV